MTLNHGPPAIAIITGGAIGNKESFSSLLIAGPYRTLDAWRGLACLWVLLLHVSELILHRFPDLHTNIFYRFCSTGGLGVQLFFVISGYCVANAACSSRKREHGTRRFIFARLRRIYPPFWVAAFLTIAALAVFRTLVHAGFSRENAFSGVDYSHLPPVYYLGNILLAQVLLRQNSLVAVSWTLCYEVAFYAVIAGALILLRGSQSDRSLLAALHATTILCLFGLIIVPSVHVYPFDLWPQFGLGVLVYDLVRSPGRRIVRVNAVIIVGLTLYLLSQPDRNIGNTYVSQRVTYGVCMGFASILVAGYSFDELMSRTMPVRILAFIGGISYSLYLVHILAMRGVNQLVLARLPSAVFHPIAFPLAMTVCIVGGYCFFAAFERPFTQSARSKAETVPQLEL